MKNSTTYEPNKIENHWYQIWEDSGLFKASGEGNPFSIMIPPPNVTGNLHMGHAFQDTIMDTLIRYHRMCGDNTLWQVGTDHAGIATQMVVERLLTADGMTRHDLGREKFIEKVWQWKEKSGGNITQQLRRMGASVDWSRERFTMDEGLSNAVNEVFVKLFDEDLIYRGKRLVNWDPTLHTAISDLEVENKDRKGHLWHLRYPLANDLNTLDGKDYLVVATTRPETMLGDAAVAVNPEDDRYQHLIGGEVLLPLVNRKIPIVADSYVDMEFGTGCVKITPAHDFNDYELGKRHQLPLINIFDKNAAILSNADIYHKDTEVVEKIKTELPENYAQQDRFAARKMIVADFEALGLLEKIDDHDLTVPYGDRSGVVVEPYLTDQWYVAIESLAKPAIDAVKNGDIEFVPKQWENTYFSWMNDIQDWCISRQLWWGHRIPAWYDEQGNIYVGKNETAVREKYQLDEALSIKQDDDVLDTWFSSALWTFSTLGWPEDTPELKTFHPSSVLVTGFDIIFFWVARMIMMTLKFTGEVPFKKVYVHGLIRDAEGQKMSKSKGNVLDPLSIIDGITLEELLQQRATGLMQPKLAAKIAKQTKKQFPEGINAYGTDALRFTFMSLASTGRDIQFDIKRLEGYRNFCNKLWNAARYVFMNTENFTLQNQIPFQQLPICERWILSEMDQCFEQVKIHIDSFRFDMAAQALYDFTWHQFCDWYLELSKPSLLNTDSNETDRKGTQQTLLIVLNNILKLLHPMMPFITEEIWQSLRQPLGLSEKSIMQAQYPQPTNTVDQKAISSIEWMKSFILVIRNIRGEMNIAPGKPIPVLLKQVSDEDNNQLETLRSLLIAIAKLSSIEILDDNEKAPMSSSGHVGNMEILIPMAGLIDKNAEISRLNKEINKLKSEQERIDHKLSNENFTARAPEQVVAKEKLKREGISISLQKFKIQLSEIEKL